MSSVGIFWFVPDRAHARMIADATPLESAEPYGAFLTHPLGHYHFWTTLQRLPPDVLHARIGVATPHHHEYEDWPRGRIVHHRPTGRFIIYADAQLHRPAFIAEIVRAFDLADTSYDVRRDVHYSRARRLALLPGDAG